jgi:hypothetical protein
MSVADAFRSEFDEEEPATRKLLERLPAGKGAWKPHPRSSALGPLAQLVARMPGVLADIVEGRDLDLAAGPPYTDATEGLVTELDDNVARLRQVLAGASDEQLGLSWRIRHGENVIDTAVRKDAFRNTLRHFVHHRGQLTVYLRLQDVPLPALYGPTADEPWQG